MTESTSLPIVTQNPQADNKPRRHLYRIEHNNTGWLHVIAVNKVQAKSFFIHYVNHDWGDDLTWEDAPELTMRVLKRGVDAPLGVDAWFEWSVANGWMRADWFALAAVTTEARS